MPNVEIDPAASNPAAWIGVNVPIVMPGLFCALGQVEVAGLWFSNRPLVHRWRANLPPLARSWKPAVPPHRGGF